MGSEKGILPAILLIILGFTTLILGNYLVYNITDSTNSLGAAPVGTLTLSGNTSCGDYINITTTALVPLYINITGGGCVAAPSGVATITLGTNQNNSTISATNISAAINANGTLSGVLTASNPSAGVVVITNDTVGSAGNSYATTETMTNGAWGSATMTGGYNIALGAATIISYATTVIPLFGLALMVLGFSYILYALRNESSGRN